MPIRDRRSGQQRRASDRYTIELDIDWEGIAGRLPGSISDVSLDGCFVLSAGDTNDGDTVKLFVPLADGIKVQFEGKVANHVYDIGFGVRFGQLSAAQRDLLIKIIRETQGV